MTTFETSDGDKLCYGPLEKMHVVDETTWGSRRQFAVIEKLARTVHDQAWVIITTRNGFDVKQVRLLSRSSESLPPWGHQSAVSSAGF